MDYANVDKDVLAFVVATCGDNIGLEIACQGDKEYTYLHVNASSAHWVIYQLWQVLEHILLVDGGNWYIGDEDYCAARIMELSPENPKAKIYVVRVSY